MDLLHSRTLPNGIVHSLQSGTLSLEKMVVDGFQSGMDFPRILMFVHGRPPLVD